MPRASRTIFLLLVLVGAGYYYREQVETFALQTYRELAPCTTAISYSIGEIDPRFHISTSTLVEALQEATDIWHTGTDRELFRYDQEDGRLTIDLVYDTRQATTQKLASLGLSVEDDLQSYEALRERYLAMNASYDAKRDAFERSYAAYENDVRAYDAEVEKWNARGGAPRSVYNELEKEQSSLETRGAQLEAEQKEVNNLASQINTVVAQLNRLAATLNISVDAYNKVGEGTDEEFEEAVYESRPGSQRISVFEYDSEARLRRVLAHEFGHALGLDHVDDPGAIMYRLNQSKNQVLTDADKKALADLCGA